MNRTIKFRGKRLDNGEWCYGYYNYINDSHTIQWENDDGAPWWADVDHVTVGQFTGLLDRNGNEIYEGDIIMLGNYKNNPCVVGWNEGVSAFCIRFQFELFMGLKPLGAWRDYVREIRVIGNIHDNPERMNLT